MNRSRAFTLVAGLALAACSGSPTDPLSDVESADRSASGVDVWADIVVDPANADRRTYTFDDLNLNCGWNVTTSGLYEDLAFPPLAYMAPCGVQNGTIGLKPSREGIASAEVRVGLPSEASAVSVEVFRFSDGTVPRLVAYDVNGDVIADASDPTFNEWVVLEVDGGGTAITEIGLDMPQLRVHLDNLTVTYVGEEPQIDPDPDPLPDAASTDPVVKDECHDGAWEALGFRNQGQCVRFVETGQDSR